MEQDEAQLAALEHPVPPAARASVPSPVALPALVVMPVLRVAPVSSVSAAHVASSQGFKIPSRWL
ncbi:hypothetical protein D7X99_03975 [Corallococcus sp. AB032C]|nr:hypothetical protein D7X99_03975 [Corallococcus sp. AB032C]